MRAMYLQLKLKQLIDAAEEKHLVKTHLFMGVGLHYGNFLRALKGEIGFSDEMLQKIAAIPEFEITYAELLLLKFLDNYGPETLDDFLEAGQAWRKRNKP